MSLTFKQLIAHHAKLTVAVMGLGLVFAGEAATQPLTTPCENQPDAPWLLSTNDPEQADEAAVRKLIHLYNWALDDQKASRLTGLFTEKVFYELCNAAGEQLSQTTGDELVRGYLDGYFTSLVDKATQTRHVESNTLLHSVDANTIQGKTTVLVTLQHSDIETPVLDYTGVLRTEFKKAGNIWKFSRITLIIDSPRLELRAR